MEQKPHKKEELMVANSVLKLAEDLLKVNLEFKYEKFVNIVLNSTVALTYRDHLFRIAITS